MAPKYLWKEGRRVGQARPMGDRQQTLLTQRTLAHPGPSVVRRIQRKWIDPQFRRYRPQYVFFTTTKVRGLTLVKICSNPCSRSQRIRRHTRSCTSFYSALSALIPLMTSRRPSVGTTGNSLTPNSGTIVNRHLIRTGLLYFLEGSGFLLIV